MKWRGRRPSRDVSVFIGGRIAVTAIRLLWAGVKPHDFRKGAMSAETPPNQHFIRLGEIYFQWDSKDRHYLAIDLSGPLPAWVVEADSGLVPLGEYLARHPGRREEVRQQIRRRLAMAESPPPAPG